jgi:hypothetical protein
MDSIEVAISKVANHPWDFNLEGPFAKNVTVTAAHSLS